MRKVILTAGHQGPGTGASCYIDEGAETISLRDKIKFYLERDHNIKPEIDDNKLSLKGVVAWIKKQVKKSDIVVDIHFNAAIKDKATGVEVLVSNSGDIERPMAKELCESISKTLGITNRGVKGESSGHHSKLAMLSNFEAEQMILEVCFCDNKKDSDAYTGKKWVLAKNIANIIAKYAKQ